MTTLRPSSNGDFLDVRGVADLLGISTKTVLDTTYDVTSSAPREPRQVLPAIKVGRSWRYSRQALSRAASAQPAPSAPVLIPVKRRSA